MEKSKAIRRAEAALILLLLLALILPQVIGSDETAARESEETVGDIASPADLQDKRFAVVLGSAYDVMVPKLFPNAKMNFVVDWAEECIQVGQGKADAVLGGFICFMRMSSNPLPSAFARIYIRWLQGMPIVLMLLILFALGADEETITADFLLTNEYNSALIAEEREYLIENGVTEEELEAFMKVMDQVFPDFMENAIQWMTETYGSPLGYITQALGVTEAELQALQDKFLE